MSRTNLKTARELREEESLKARKLILKSGGSATNQNIGAKAALAGDEAYQKKFEELKKFSKKSKEIRKFSTQKTEWVDEYYLLQRYVDKTEKNIAELFQNIASTCMFQSETFSAAMDDYTKYSINLNSYRHETSNQIKEIKAMLKSSVKSLRVPSAADSEMTIQQRAAISMFAEVLLLVRCTPSMYLFLMNEQMRNSHRDEWIHLGNEQAKATDAVNCATVDFCRMQAHYRSMKNSHRMSEELEELENDSPDVLNELDEWRQKVFKCDEEYAQDMSIIALERAKLKTDDEVNDIENDEGENVAAGKSSNNTFGGWSEFDHLTFTKTFKRSHTQGLARNKLMEILCSELPHYSREDILHHEEWYRKLCALQDRKRVRSKEYEAMREKLLSEGKSKMSEFRLKCDKERMEEEYNMRREERMKELQSHLEIQRAIRIESMQERLQEIQQLKDKLAEDSLKDAEKRLQDALAKKAMVEKFHRDREIIKAEQNAMEDESHRVMEKKRKEDIELAKPKIAQREEMLKAKSEERKRKEELFQQEELLRIEALNRLAEQVPYFEALQNVESKLDHITASVQSHTYVKGDELTRGHIPLNGFTDVKVFRDAKFRLGLALRQAGIHHTNAARDAIANITHRQQAPW